MLNKLTLTQAVAGLKAKKFSSAELVSDCLSQISKFDSKIHAFLHVNPRALDQAKKVNTDSPLAGVPLAVKDNFLTVGMPTTAASNVLDSYQPPFESTVTSRLLKAGAVIIGKTNMDAWAHGSSTETSDFGPTFNPWNTDRLPGGSSGGSAAAVAAHMCTAAIGSETAGSIRQPAGWCGVTGFKPTYGRVSRYGVVAMASSTDSPGPITKSVEDAALLTQIIAGRDPFDATSSPLPVPDYPVELKNKNLPVRQAGLRIGVPKEYLDVMHPEARNLVLDAVKQLEKLGHLVQETSLIHPKYSIGVYTIVQRSEVSSNLARYDGIRYGRDRSYFSQEAKRRIMLGTFALSAGYHEQFYSRAQKLRTLIIRDFQTQFTKLDLLICPASPGTAVKVGSTGDDPMFGENQDMLVEPSSIAGLTGISVPCGLVDGLPVSFGLVGPQFSESLVLSAAHQYQQATDWHTHYPKL